MQLIPSSEIYNGLRLTSNDRIRQVLKYRFRIVGQSD